MPESSESLLGHLVALLFVSSQPLELATAARVLRVSEREIEAFAARLAESPPPGLMLQRQGRALQLATAPASAPYVRRLLGTPEVQRLSHPALEVLAIVAYRQPVTRADVDGIRGVDSGRALATLLARGLIEEVGRKETVGRPVLFGTSVGFLEYLGLRSLADLPKVDGLGPGGNDSPARNDE